VLEEIEVEIGDDERGMAARDRGGMTAQPGSSPADSRMWMHIAAAIVLG
jgi:hypothetical protein